MAAISGDDREIKRRLCRALGLDPSEVASIEIRVFPADAVKAHITKYVTEKEFDIICLELEQCEKV